MGYPTWVRARVVSVMGPKSYQVELEDGQVWRRHIDQLWSRLGETGLRQTDNPAVQPDQVSTWAQSEPSPQGAYKPASSNPYNKRLVIASKQHQDPSLKPKGGTRTHLRNWESSDETQDPEKKRLGRSPLRPWECSRRFLPRTQEWQQAWLHRPLPLE